MSTSCVLNLKCQEVSCCVSIDSLSTYVCVPGRRLPCEHLCARAYVAVAT